MKNCEYNGCSEEIDDKYKFCFNHWKAGGQTAPNPDKEGPSKLWDPHPEVDALLKINHHLRLITKQNEAVIQLLIKIDEKLGR